MANVIRNLDVPYLKALIYGNAGAGKTRLVGTSALDDRMYPCLYLNYGGNPVSIRTYERLPLVIDITKLSDFNAIYDYLAKGQPKTHPVYTEIVEPSGIEEPFKCVIIDQLTDLQNFVFFQVAHPNGLPPATIPKKRGFDEYNKVKYFCDNFTDLFYKLPLHVIFTAWEQSIDKDKYPDSCDVMPMFEGASRKSIAGRALLVGRIQPKQALPNALLSVLKRQKEEPEYNVIFFESKGNFLAKNQYGGTLPKYLCDPTMTQILDGIKI